MWPFSRKNREATPSLVIDPSYGDPTSRRLIDALTNRDWRTARDVFAAATDPDERAFLMEAATGVDDVQEWIQEWVAAEPESTLPVLVRGCHAVQWAWEARGAKRAQYTSGEQFREFARRLKLAENLLNEVVERDPDDVTAWTWLVASARGRQVGRAEAQARFDEVIKRHPLHIVAHEEYLQFLCAKWSGSHELMFEFARKATAAAPEGSWLPELIAVAHLEKWVSLPSGEDAEWIRQPDVREEIVAAAAKSYLHPNFRTGPGWVPRVATFALMCEFVEAFEAAGHAHDLLGDQASRWPWLYCGDPVEAFIRGREYVHENRP
ncbi:DUF4034 domain-containing protein [Actinoplanes derwentensis]|uniref:DUF4034 domain-containing protein n=1 Tax=Actinoplanes derwentensis TaxID=113562 RepID=A0A1H2B1S1_9ACTN|nr:DUF4034 domain-containing protein [Actinoplanes derwentensis]GID87616.1 hypothetical protein Ade03nite_65400 [Actinoplanes derwentensis]SDT51726.1 protein of unknown function [Actinoplanes derwentensis]